MRFIFLRDKKVNKKINLKYANSYNIYWFHRFRSFLCLV